MTEGEPTVLTGTPVTSAPATEPAVLTGTLVALATMVVNGLLIFGQLSLTTDQRSYVIGAIAVLAPLIAGIWIRFKVWSPATVDRIIAHYQTQVLAAQRVAERAQVSADMHQQALNVALPAALNEVLDRQRALQAPQQPQEAPQMFRPPQPPDEQFARYRSAQPSPRPREYSDPQYGYEGQYDDPLSAPWPDYQSRHAMREQDTPPGE
jgi:hypothetical protein